MIVTIYSNKTGSLFQHVSVMDTVAVQTRGELRKASTTKRSVAKHYAMVCYQKVLHSGSGAVTGIALFCDVLLHSQSAWLRATKRFKQRLLYNAQSQKGAF